MNYFFIIMKHKRIIAIKDPRLRKIRNEFRNLWSAAESAEWNKLGDEMEELDFDEEGHRIFINERTPENLKYYRSLQDTQSELRRNFRNSICMCRSCGRADLDMYYNRSYRTWFCVECVKGIINGYANIITKKALGTYYCGEDDDDNDFEESFL